MSDLSADIKANQGILTDFFNPAFTRTLNEQVLERIVNPVFFRPRFIGFEEDLERRNPNVPNILVSNHSGMAFPWDAVAFGCGMYKMKNYELNRLFRPMVSPMLTDTRLMNPLMVQDCWKMCGGIDATFLNFETMMHQQECDILIYPEGVPGIGKGWNKRYQVQRAATSFVRMSLKYDADIILFSTVNAEYVNPFAFSLDWVNRIIRRIGIPFLPLSFIIPLLILQPWVFYMAFPANITFVRGKRIRTRDLAPDKPFEEFTQDDFDAVRNKVKDLMQAALTADVEIYGKQPYKWGEMFRKAWEHRHYFPYYFPFMWPFLYTEFERQWYAQEHEDGKNVNLEIGWFTWLKWLVKSPIIVAYFIPVIGWLPLILKGYTRKNHHK